MLGLDDQPGLKGKGVCMSCMPGGMVHQGDRLQRLATMVVYLLRVNERVNLSSFLPTSIQVKHIYALGQMCFSSYIFIRARNNSREWKCGILELKS